MPTRIIAEVGSTHMGKWDYCREAIDRCADLNIDAIKFQLFPNEERFTASGNVWMPPDLYLRCVEYSHEQRLQCSASVFGADEFDFLLKTKPPFVKFAFSQKDQTPFISEALSQDIETIVSCDIMTDKLVPHGTTKLFCIPQYPVYFNISFDEIFPRFDGFSDHSLGFNQTLEAVASGAKIVEKHITLNHTDIDCPDSFFALRPGDFSAMVHAIKLIDRKAS